MEDFRKLFQFSECNSLPVEEFWPTFKSSMSARLLGWITQVYKFIPAQFGILTQGSSMNLLSEDCSLKNIDGNPDCFIMIFDDSSPDSGLL